MCKQMHAGWELDRRAPFQADVTKPTPRWSVVIQHLKEESENVYTAALHNFNIIMITRNESLCMDTFNKPPTA